MNTTANIFAHSAMKTYIERMWKILLAETWKPMVGFEGLYEVSNLGRIKSLKRNSTSGGIIKTHVNRGYEYFHPCKNGKHRNMKVHRAVAEAFIPNPDNKPDVNHKDENPLNNRVDNLEWATKKENVNYGTRSERTAQKVRKAIVQFDMEGNRIQAWPSSLAIERALGYAASNIRSCCNGIAKSAYGFVWKHESCMDSYRREVLPE
jgi:hypothetical protein